MFELESGNKIMIAGNGGSAAVPNLATEFRRFKGKSSLPAVSLTTDVYVNCNFERL